MAASTPRTTASAMASGRTSLPRLRRMEGKRKPPPDRRGAGGRIVLEEDRVGGRT